MTNPMSLYSRLGGDLVLREFVTHLYHFMDTLEEVEYVRNMHSDDLSFAGERLYMFLSGMLGGPPLYMESFGQPRLRRKHMKFEIGDEERDQWMLCARLAAERLELSKSLKDELIAELAAMADHLRNKNMLPDSSHRCVAGAERGSCHDS